MDLPLELVAQPRSLYVHLPFCETKCSYCAFHSIGRDATPDGQIERYVEALIREIRTLPSGAEIDTIYFGGGTPSLLPPTLLRQIADAVEEVVVLSPGYEWTMEMNPGSAHDDRLAVARDIGVTRISLGVQTFDATRLRQLERVHGPEDVHRSVGSLRRYGFDDFNLDLIYGLPGQGLSGFTSDLEALLDFAPPHISLYNLQFEDGTTMTYRRLAAEIEEEDEAVQIAMFDLAWSKTAGAGLDGYEISNFARTGREARHNLNYWMNRPYFGLGAGAWGFVDGRRYRNVAPIERYIAAVDGDGSLRQEDERIDARSALTETIISGLRMTAGVEVARLERLFGEAARDRWLEPAARFREAGFLDDDPRRLRLTHAGRLVSDTVFLGFTT